MLSAEINGFRLAYDRFGAGPPVVLLHGWPGDRADYREVAQLLPAADVIVPDLRGFGDSDRHESASDDEFGADAQARSVIGLIEELGLQRTVLGAHDIGSRVAQTIARTRPDLLSALVLTPPLPGIGDRISTADAQRQFWYVPFHQLPVAAALVDGRDDLVRAYLTHFLEAWSAPGFVFPAPYIEQLVETFARPDSFRASLRWYRAARDALSRIAAEHAPEPSARIAVPTTVLWPLHDPLFPRVWSDRLGEFFTDVRVQYEDCGHFVPAEAPQSFADAVTRASMGRP